MSKTTFVEFPLFTKKLYQLLLEFILVVAGEGEYFVLFDTCPSTRRTIRKLFQMRIEMQVPYLVMIIFPRPEEVQESSGSNPSDRQTTGDYRSRTSALQISQRPAPRQ
jgi:hypothetical protein